MDCKAKLEAYLRENQVPYQTQHHPLAYTAQEVAAREHIPGRLMAKTVMVIMDGKMVMAVICAPCHLNLSKVRAILGGVEARLAHESEFVNAFPDCDLGAMPPFGNLYDIPVYVDHALAEDETIVFRAGSHTDTISLQYADYARLVQPVVADIALPPK
jgi:Ala-tRNA(Pro) deacylase